MADTSERIEEIATKLNFPWARNDHGPLILIALMEEDIAYKLAGNYQPFYFTAQTAASDEYDVMEHTHTSRLEATYAAWKVIKEQQQ